MKYFLRTAAVLAIMSVLCAMLPAAGAAAEGIDLSIYTKQQLEEMTMVVTGDYVNMRAGYAGTPGHAKIVNWGNGLMKGDIVYCLDKHDGWYCVVKFGINIHGCIAMTLYGWVWGDYVVPKSKYNGDVNSKFNEYIGGKPGSESDVIGGPYNQKIGKVIRTLDELEAWE